MEGINKEEIWERIERTRDKLNANLHFINTYKQLITERKQEINSAEESITELKAENKKLLTILESFGKQLKEERGL